ncbi:hypothetical protein CR513_62031, partial [Mucuna pruriens]
MEGSKLMSLPILLLVKLTNDESSKPTNQTTYKGMIVSLLYLIASILYIMYSVCLCARFQYDPIDSYFIVAKMIFCYLDTTIQTIMCDRTKRKSTSGAYHFIGPCLISRSKIAKLYILVKLNIDEEPLMFKNI